MSNDSADTPSVRAEVSPTTAKVGDVVTLDIHVDHPLVLAVDPPAFAKDLGDFEVRTSTRLPVQINGDRGIDRFQAELQAFTTGQHKLPGLDVPYRDSMGHQSVVRTPELVVTIEDVPAGPNDKGDIRGIVGALGPAALSPWWWLLALSLIFAICFLLWRKRERARLGPPPPPPVPADEEALTKLRDLQASSLLAAGKIKEFYSAISETLRGYLERGFQVPALERTTSELMRDLRKKQPVASERQIDLKQILEDCDLVKFAKYRPDTKEAEEKLAQAFRFVEQTKGDLRKTDELH